LSSPDIVFLYRIDTRLRRGSLVRTMVQAIGAEKLEGLFTLSNNQLSAIWQQNAILA
jgi:hypothetical protein